MSHLKLSQQEIELFIRSMKSYKDKLWEDHPYDYSYSHKISKEKRYVDQTIGKMENELKVRAMRPHRVTA